MRNFIKKPLAGHRVHDTTECLGYLTDTEGNGVEIEHARSWPPQFLLFPRYKLARDVRFVSRKTIKPPKVNE